MSVEKVLQKLQAMARTPSKPDARPGMSFRIPADLAQEERRGLTLDYAERALLEQAVREVELDLRFEHLKDAKEALLRFVAEAWVDRTTNHVPAFVRKHHREVVSTDCVLTVLYLEVPVRLEVAGTQLLPLGDELVPDVPELTTEPSCAGYISIPCTGTNYGKMVERARAQADHALALLRAGLEQRSMYNRRQLRFRLGERYAFTDRLFGWTRRADVAYQTPINQDVARRFR